MGQRQGLPCWQGGHKGRPIASKNRADHKGRPDRINPASKNSSRFGFSPEAAAVFRCRIYPGNLPLYNQAFRHNFATTAECHHV